MAAAFESGEFALLRRGFLVEGFLVTATGAAGGAGAFVLDAAAARVVRDGAVFVAILVRLDERVAAFG